MLTVGGSAPPVGIFLLPVTCIPLPVPFFVVPVLREHDLYLRERVVLLREHQSTLREGVLGLREGSVYLRDGVLGLRDE